MSTGTLSPPEVVAFSALPHFLPFIILKENVHYLAVLISGHHGPVVFAFGDGADVEPCGRPAELTIFRFRPTFFRAFGLKNDPTAE